MTNNQKSHSLYDGWKGDKILSSRSDAWPPTHHWALWGKCHGSLRARHGKVWEEASRFLSPTLTLKDEDLGARGCDSSCSRATSPQRRESWAEASSSLGVSATKGESVSIFHENSKDASAKVGGLRHTVHG